MADLLADPHVAARDAIVEVDGVRMPGMLARLSRTPGEVRHAGRPLGADTEAVLAQPWADRDGAGARTRDAPRSVGVETHPRGGGPNGSSGRRSRALCTTAPGFPEPAVDNGVDDSSDLGRKPDDFLPGLTVSDRDAGNLEPQRSSPGPADEEEVAVSCACRMRYEW